MTFSKFIIPADYAQWLSSLKTRISGAQQRAALAVNQELVQLYHHIGSEILERQTRQGWGAKVIDRLASDLREAFPEMKGFSSRNLKYMKFFAQQCPSGLIGQQAAAQLPWFHLVTLLTKVSAEAEREWTVSVSTGSPSRCSQSATACPPTRVRSSPARSSQWSTSSTFTVPPATRHTPPWEARRLSDCSVQTHTRYSLA